MEWVVGIVAVLLFFAWRNAKSSAKGNLAHLVSERCRDWVESQGIAFDTIRFSVYYGRPYTLLADGCALVGWGDRRSGGQIGFVIDVSENHGVMGGRVIAPYTVATWHARASRLSLESGFPIATILSRMVEAHEQKQRPV